MLITFLSTIMFTLIVCFCVTFIPTFSFDFVKLSEELTLKNTGEPAFLTELIKEGKFNEAKDASYVKPMKGNVFSYSGFFTVKNTTQCKSNMFFWFFHSESGPTAPVVLWLQGGPGISSLVGVYEESGPFYVKPKRGLKLRNYYWTQAVSVLYIDNPVGTGFSFTNNDNCYSKNEDDVADNLLEALRQFFLLFSDYQKNDFFINGESYAGKYASTLALSIDKYNNQNDNQNGLKINLKGISIGNCLCDPVNMLSYGNFLYQIGLIDANGLNTFQFYEKKIRGFIQTSQYDKAFNTFDTLIKGDLTPNRTLFNSLTGFTNYYNYWFSDNVTPYGDLKKFVESDIARRSIHVGNLTFNADSKKVKEFLLNDIMQSVSASIAKILDNKNYRVLIYSGQSDVIVPYPSTINFIKSLNWSGQKSYATAKRQLFVVQKTIEAGYFKQVDNFIEVMIRDAGHMVSKDQPLWALDMITRFVYNKPFQ